MVNESYTITPVLEKLRTKPRSHNCPTESKFIDSLGTRYVSEIDKWGVLMEPKWLISMRDPSAVWIGESMETLCLVEKEDELEDMWLQQAESKSQKEVPNVTERAEDGNLVRDKT